MSLIMSACACMGPIGDCPCIRRSKDLSVPINETYLSQSAWGYLTDEEKKIINDLKLTAALRSIFETTPKSII